jgi:hypothetical protein
VGKHRQGLVRASSAVSRWTVWLAVSAAALDLAGEEFADARPVRNQAALTELAAPHRQELPPRVDVADAKAARLPDTQSQPVAECEDGVVGGAAADGPGVVGQRRGRLKQQAGLADVEEERQAHVRLASPHSVQR